MLPPLSLVSISFMVGSDMHTIFSTVLIIYSQYFWPGFDWNNSVVVIPSRHLLSWGKLQSPIFSCGSICFMISYFMSSLIVQLVWWCFVMVQRIQWECVRLRSLPMNPQIYESMVMWFGQQRVIRVAVLSFPPGSISSQFCLGMLNWPHHLWHVTKVHKVCHSLAEQIYWYPLDQFRVCVAINHPILILLNAF